MASNKFKIANTHKDPTKGKVYIVEYVYDPSKKRSRTVYRKLLGKRVDVEKKGKAWVEAELEKFINEHETQKTNDNKTGPKRVFNFFEAPCAKVIEELGVQKFLVKQANNRKLPKQWPLTALALVMNRIMVPNSKRATYSQLQCSAYNYSSIDFADVYNVLAFLAKIKDKLIKGLNDGLSAIKNRDLSIVIYDVSTFYFESFDEDELRQKGMSKDNKRNETQVVLGLLIDNDGIPYAYELFPGNTHESNTMIPVLQKFIQAHHLDPKQVIVVADAGLNQGRNLHAMVQAGFSFIVGFPINGKCSKDLQNTILDDDGWEAFSEDSCFKSVNKNLTRSIVLEDGEKIKWEFSGRFVIGFSKARRIHDLDTIEKQAIKTQKRIELASPGSMTPDLVEAIIEIDEDNACTDDIPAISPKVNAKIKYQLRESKIANRMQWAGYIGLITNIDETRMSIRQIFGQQHAKWQVEDNFRCMKTTLETRPIFVRKKEHIEGHFVMCYIALFVNRVMQWKCRAAGFNYSLDMIQKAFSDLKVGMGKGKNNLEMSSTYQAIGTSSEATATVASHVFESLGMPALPDECSRGYFVSNYGQRWLTLRDLA